MSQLEVNVKYFYKPKERVHYNMKPKYNAYSTFKSISGIIACGLNETL